MRASWTGAAGRWYPAVLGVMACLSATLFVAWACRRNGHPGFPLDDPWIHLTFARNLVEHGSLSYFPGDPPVAGSTSPLYTFLVSGLYALRADEYLASYVVGIAGFAACVVIGVRLASLVLPPAPSLVWGLFLLTQPRLLLMAGCGMETTLFTALCLGALLAYGVGKPLAAGSLVGLSVWCRPEGVLVGATIAADWVARALCGRPRWSTRQVVRGLLAAGLLVGAYLAFHWLVSGTPLPTTFGAKGAYYRATSSREHFLSFDVVQAYARRELSLVGVAALLGAGFALWRSVEGNPPAWLVHLVFPTQLVGAYWLLLPFGHRFQRYLLPGLPSLLLVAWVAVWEATRAVLGPRGRTLLRLAAGMVLAGQWGQAMPEWHGTYAACCRYHATHHVEAAKWLSHHTPPEACVATHDIGALAFYGRRRVVDMAGIVSPQVIRHIGTPWYTSYLDSFLASQGATHVVTLREWFVPTNAPLLFVPSPEPDILGVFAFVPGGTHIELPVVASLNAQALRCLSLGRPQEALALVDRALSLDPGSCQARFVAGMAWEAQGDLQRAVAIWSEVVARWPRFTDARLALARGLAAVGDQAGALAQVQECLRVDPSCEPAQSLLSKLSGFSR